MKTRYKAVLFDLDGTLLDTIDDLSDSMNASLASLGLSGHGVKEYKIFVGEGIEHLAKRSLPENRRDPQTIKTLVAAMRKEYSQRWAAKTKPYDGIVELLADLAKKGLKLAVLSNKPDDFSKLMIRHYFPTTEFSAVAGHIPGGTKKPDPTGAIAIAESLHLRPAEFIYIGDTNTDMQTAVSAGMFPVGALWGFRSAGELTQSGAKVLIESPMQLPELLDKLNG
ncbi:MAG: HAD family hydrolase [Planctomycetes bacterium]|nr:HAD family hydrolase [Planctomycetota bacterium]